MQRPLNNLICRVNPTLRPANTVLFAETRSKTSAIRSRTEANAGRRIEDSGTSEDPASLCSNDSIFGAGTGTAAGKAFAGYTSSGFFCERQNWEGELATGFFTG